MAVFQQYQSFLTRKNVARQLKKRLFDMCILPAMLYGSETWTTIKDTRYELAVAQRRMERMMINVTWQDRISNDELRRKTKITVIIQAAAECKAMWARSVTLMDQERWAQATMYWQPEGRRRVGRPLQRWSDDMRKAFGNNDWQRRIQYLNDSDTRLLLYNIYD